MRNNNNTPTLKHINILKFPNINYYISNAPYYEIMDTAIIRENTNSDNEKDIKCKRISILLQYLQLW